MSSILETMRRRAITLVSATYGPDGQLHQNVISGPKLPLVCLPEEGLYVLHRNRGLQIASACDRRTCCATQVCRCTEQQQPIHAHMATVFTNFGIDKQSPIHLAKKYLQDRALAWLNFREAADEIRALRLCFLAQPRTLSWDSIFDHFAFHFDSELQEHCVSAYGYAYIPQSVKNGIKECPQGVLDFIRDTWQDFLNCGYYDSRPAITFPEMEDDESTEDHAYDGDVDDLSEWDDTDTPIYDSEQNPPTPSINHRKRPRPEDDFDFIDDLIDEEFPRLKKAMLEPQQGRESAKHTSLGRPEKIQKTNNAAESNIARNTTIMHNSISIRRKRALDANVSHEGLPVPVIIPPKNMLIGRSLADCSFDEHQGFGSSYGHIGQSARAVLPVASPC